MPIPTLAPSTVVGKLYRFKSHDQWPIYARLAIVKNEQYQKHPVIVVSIPEDGIFEVVTITSNPQYGRKGWGNYVPIGFTKPYAVHEPLHVAESDGALEKDSWVVLDSVRPFPKYCFVPWLATEGDEGSQYSLGRRSKKTLPRLVRERESALGSVGVGDVAGLAKVWVVESTITVTVPASVAVEVKPGEKGQTSVILRLDKPLGVRIELSTPPSTPITEATKRSPKDYTGINLAPSVTRAMAKERRRLRDTITGVYNTCTTHILANINHTIVQGEANSENAWHGGTKGMPGAWVDDE